MTVCIRPRAKLDIDEIARYIADHNVTAAKRFYERLDATLDLLLLFPGAGALALTRNRRLTGLR